MNNFVIIDKNLIQLNSGLDEYMFGKTSYSSIITQAGIYFDGENFSNWTFDEIKSQDVQGKDSPQVFYSGTNPFNNDAKTLLDYFESNDRNLIFNKAFAVIKALTKAATENFPLPLNGAGGILVEAATDNPRILFLPGNAFSYSCNGLSARDKANANDCWLNPSLSDLPALCFLRATIAYTMLTGQFPFPSADQLERNADILDQKFLPLELRLPGVSEELAKQVNNALKLTSTIVNEPGKKQKGTSTEQLKPVANFPLDLLLNEKNNVPSPELQKELNEKAEAYKKRQESQINTKRIIRRNTSAILLSILAVFAVALIIRSGIKSHGEEYTTKGLTSTETIIAFFKNVNNKDVAALGNFVNGKSASRYTDGVSQVYVISKQRQSMTGDNGFAKPENYFLYVTDAYKNQNSGMYGITNLKIDDVPYELEIKVPTFNSKPKALQEEDGVSLVNKMQTQHKVEYYRLRTENDTNDIILDYITDVVTLTFKDNRWFISDFNTHSEELELNSSAFKLEYFKVLQDNDMDVIKAVNQMRFQYPWLPSERALILEIEHLKDLEQHLYAGV